MTDQAGFGVLIASVEQHLHAHAHAEHRLAGSDEVADRRVQTAVADGAHARAEVADAGDHQGVGASHLGRVARDQRRAADARQRARDRWRLPEP